MSKGKYQAKGSGRGINWLIIILLLVVLTAFVACTVLLIHACLYIGDAPDTTPDTSLFDPQDTQPETKPTLNPPSDPTAPPESEPETEPETGPEETVPEIPPEYDDTTSRNIVAMANSVVGTPYAFGGSGPEEFDTTGLIYYCFRQCGIDAPRLLDEQYAYGEAVAQEFLQPGDVVFFYLETPGEVEYVGIYTGNNTFVAVSSSRNAVAEQNMGIDYFAERYVGARRYS